MEKQKQTKQKQKSQQKSTGGSDGNVDVRTIVVASASASGKLLPCRSNTPPPHRAPKRMSEEQQKRSAWTYVKRLEQDVGEYTHQCQLCAKMIKSRRREPSGSWFNTKALTHCLKCHPELELHIKAPKSEPESTAQKSQKRERPKKNDSAVKRPRVTNATRTFRSKGLKHTETAMQKYSFDVQGFVVIQGVLTEKEVKRCNQAIDRNADSFFERAEAIRNTNKQSQFAEDCVYKGRLENGTFLTDWPDKDAAAFRNLLAHPKLVPILNELVGEGFRLDHMPLILRQRHQTEGFDLHGGRISENGTYNRDLAYDFAHGQQHCKLLALSVALTDTGPGDGGFCIAPGTHKANFPTPTGMVQDKDSHLLVYPILKAGDVILFSEATLHGASSWTKQDSERRLVLLRFAPSTAAYGRGYLDGWPKDFQTKLTPAEKAVLLPPYGMRLDRQSTVQGSTKVHHPRSKQKKQFDKAIFKREYF